MSIETPRSSAGIALHRVAVLGAVCTLGLVFLGGSVTSNDAGMAVPDWPQTFGENMFLYPPSKWVGDVFFEHTHRLLGATVGLVMIVLAVWTQWREPRASVRRLGWVLLVAVIAQGVMGGLRVTENNVPLAIAHGCFAQLFFSATVCMVIVTSARWHDTRTVDAGAARGLKTFCVVANVTVFCQLVLGAIYRHLGHGLLYHIIGAIAVITVLCVLLMWLTGAFAGQPLLSRLASTIGALLTVQLAFGLGAFVATMSYDASRPATFWEWFTPSAHVAVGASILAFSVGLTLSVHRVLGRPAIDVGDVVEVEVVVA